MFYIVGALIAIHLWCFVPLISNHSSFSLMASVILCCHIGQGKGSHVKGKETVNNNTRYPMMSSAHLSGWGKKAEDSGVGAAITCKSHTRGANAGRRKATRINTSTLPCWL